MVYFVVYKGVIRYLSVIKKKEVKDMLVLTLLGIVFGLTLLIMSSDVFVDAASSLAVKLKVPKMLIALTIAAFGTCAPELAISFNSIIDGNVDMTMANVIGSSIVNILLIVGLAAVVSPINVKERVVKKELPLLLIITAAFFVLISDSLFDSTLVNSLTRADAIVLLCWFVGFILYILRLVRKNKVEDEEQECKYNLKTSIVLIIVSLLIIIMASDVVVDSAVYIAELLGISQKIISMTIIVIGTSLPELTMTVSSARKGEFDMAVGNIIGTNIFNMCVVLGLPIAMYGDVTSSSFNLIDTSMVLVSSIFFFIFGISDRKLSRREGILMVLVFITYYVYIIFW